MKRVVNIIRVLLSGILICFSLIGCSSYVRDNSSGAISEIMLDEALELTKQEGESIILFSLSTCKDCKNLKEVLMPYLEDHSIEIKEVVLDYEGTSDEEIQSNRNKINTIFSEFNSVPSMYYVKDGNIMDEVFEIVEESQLEEWVVKNELDKK